MAFFSPDSFEVLDRRNKLEFYLKINKVCLGVACSFAFIQCILLTNAIVTMNPAATFYFVAMIICASCFLVSLKLTINLKEKLNGNDRQSNAQVHSNSNHGASSVGVGSFTFQTSGRALTIFSGCSGSGGERRSGLGIPPIVDGGIVIGEVIAYRAWKVLLDEYLVSMNGQIWAPNEPMEGEDITVNGSSGVHAFKTLEHTQNQFGSVGYVLGRVKLWGHIVEHELGYRAQYAKPVEIFPHSASATVSKLRRKYGLD